MCFIVGYASLRCVSLTNVMENIMAACKDMIMASIVDELIKQKLHRCTQLDLDFFDIIFPIEIVS